MLWCLLSPRPVISMALNFTWEIRSSVTSGEVAETGRGTSLAAAPTLVGRARSFHVDVSCRFL